MLPNFSMNKVDYYKAGSRVMADCGVWQWFGRQVISGCGCGRGSPRQNPTTSRNRTYVQTLPWQNPSFVLRPTSAQWQPWGTYSCPRQM